MNENNKQTQRGRVAGVLWMGLLIWAGPGFGRAQEKNEVQTRVQFTVGMFQRMTVVQPDDNAPIILGVATAAEFDRGYMERVDAVGFTVESTVPWVMQARAVPVMATTGPAVGGQTHQKPISDYLCRLTGSGDKYAPFTLESRTVARGSRGKSQVSLDLRVNIDINRDPPQLYGLILIYSLVSA